MPGPITPAGVRGAIIVQAAAVAGAAVLWFTWAPAALGVEYPALAQCPPALLPLLVPRLLAASALPLLGGVAVLGMQRFLSEGINPLARPLDATVAARYLSNTVEQFALHAAAVWGLAAWGECAAAAAAVPFFVAARALFLTGYSVHPAYRAAGFGATFYPTAAALFYCAWRLVRDGPVAGLPAAAGGAPRGGARLPGGWLASWLGL